MNKKFNCYVIGMLAVPFLALTSCGNRGGGGQQIDTTKTQLYVNNYYGGFGSEWLTKAATRYEEAHKDDVWEEGKKGVQVMINNEKSNISEKMGSILNSRDEVYFNEWAYFYELKSKGIVGEITPAVTQTSPYDGKTVESKLSEAQVEYYGIKDGQDRKYYALPHYTGLTGIVYNIDLFDEKGYYLIDNPQNPQTIEDYFIYYPGDKKSAGVDGIYGTSDDGLPATYEEFYLLCEYIYATGNTPLTWTGAYSSYYINCFLNALVADCEGLETMMMNYTMNGTAKNLGRIVSGQFVKDTSSTVITPTNAYELTRNEGRYQALKFVSKIVSTSKYHGALVANSGYSHLDAQNDFLWAGHDGGLTKPIGMLIEGSWWESEATSTFEKMAAQDEKYKKENRKFGWMPLPKANEEYLAAARLNDHTSTLTDYIYGISFMKANVAEWKKPLCYDFLQFINSDESLAEYTTTTNTTKALNYTLDTADYNKLTTFGKSLYDAKLNSDMVYPYASNSVYVNNQSFFGAYSQYKSDLGASGVAQYVFSYLYNGVSPETYFSGMYTYYSAHWIV